MRKHLLFISFIIACFTATGIGQTALHGTVTDAESGDPIIFGNVALYEGSNLITGTETDFEGDYSFSNIDPGTYDVEVSYVGYQPRRVEGVLVKAGKTNNLDVQLSSGVMMEEVEVVDYTVPLIEQDNTTQGGVLTSDQIKNLPTKNINALAATTAGLSSVNDGDISIRGSRTNATDYYIDGVRVSGNLIPQTEISQMQVLTGGIPALYGDVVGGVISITTKGPSSEFSGGLEVETSEYLDDYGYNLVNLNLSGPILKDSAENRAILGYRISGQYKHQEEDNPPYTGVYRAPSSTIEALENDPVDFIGTTPILNAEKLEDEANGGAVELLDARPNTGREDFDITGKLDARLSDDIDLTLSGTYSDVQNQFTPANGFYSSGAWGLLNWERNPFQNDIRYRGNLRLRHRIGATSTQDPNLTDEEQERRKKSLLQNVSYNLQFGYEFGKSDRQDQTHGDNYFDYGYVGEFNVNFVPTIGTRTTDCPGCIQLPNTEQYIGHNGYNEQLADDGYSGNFNINPVYARFNREFMENSASPVTNLQQFPIYNGEQSNISRSVWSGIFDNVGAVYNLSQKGQNERYTANFSASFELVPSGSAKGRHSIELGATYEERIFRDWRIAPSGLWTAARQEVNAHLQGTDTTTIIDTVERQIQGLGEVSFPVFEPIPDDDISGKIYREVREITGDRISQYTNLDQVSPDQMSLDMFSPTELTDQNVVNYYGYDYLGNKVSADVTFEDFFTATDEDGQRTFDVAPHQPNYFAAYIQDKFSYEDIIFRVGLRVDRYDANTQVLKDQYALYDIQTADEFFANNPDRNRPPGVEDNYKVYVTDEGSTTPTGYRVEDQWYNESGTPVNSGQSIFGGSPVFPAYIPHNEIDEDGFQVESSFEDYEPQVNWMPRLAFSFPISDEANFFAHYDVLVQRPTSNVYVSPLEYYYFEDGGRTPQDNPNLKPVKTIDYEVGFQQKLSNSSALKISAYYKEMRDLIQQRRLQFVASPVNEYTTYRNIDFGTVKGFSFQYDLRRTGNVKLQANYTLQFADGTGSDPNSQETIVNSSASDQLRRLFPLNYDERHRFSFIFDFRYGSGKKYNGPELFGKDILANAGLNLQATVASGRPFTKRKEAQQFSAGGFENTINGSRLPWNYTLDLRIDKNFRLTNPSGDRSEEPLFLNVYLRIQNLLDTESIIDVYKASGSPNNDGYLSTPQGVSVVEGIRESRAGIDANIDNYLQAYQWRLLSPGNYAFPRRIYLGAIFEF